MISRPFVLHLLAAMAERERGMISARTTAALKAAKARGVKLGGPNLEQAREVAVAALQADAQRHTANVLPIIRAIQRAGASRTIRPTRCLKSLVDMPLAVISGWSPRLSVSFLRTSERSRETLPTEMAAAFGTTLSERLSGTLT